MITPKILLDFTTASLDPIVTFTRTTGASNPATYVNSSGVITASTNNQPRFNYDPVTLVCKGLLIEEQRTNLLTYSEQFDNAAWPKSNTTVSSDIEISPDGTTNGDKIIENAGTGQKYLSQIISGLIANSSYTVTCYAKFPAADRRFALTITDAQGGGSQYAGVQLLPNGSVVALDTGFTNRVFDATNAGNGWYRLRISVTISTVTTVAIRTIVLSSTGGQNYTGNGTSGVYVYGAQLEAGAFATSYIPTTTTALTRNADVATITGTNFSDFWQVGKGGATVLATPSTVSGTRPLVQYDDGTANEIIALRGNTTNPELYIVDGGAPQVQLDAGTIVANTAYSLTGWWQENNSFAQLNTQTSVRDNTVTIPTVTQARLGSDGTNYLNGTIAAIYYYDELANSIYDSLRLLGYTGTVTDMLLQYYLARGATSNSLTDAEIEFLGVKGFTTGTIDDKWTNYLISLGYFGTITDMKYQYWKSPE